MLCKSTVYQKVMMNIFIKGSFSGGYCNKLQIYPLYPLPRTTGLNTWTWHNSWWAALRLCVCVYGGKSSQNYVGFILSCHRYLDWGPWGWPHHGEHTGTCGDIWTDGHVCFVCIAQTFMQHKLLQNVSSLFISDLPCTVVPRYPVFKSDIISCVWAQTLLQIPKSHDHCGISES